MRLRLRLRLRPRRSRRMQIPTLKDQQKILYARHRRQNRTHVHRDLSQNLHIDARVAPVGRLPGDLEVVQSDHCRRDDEQTGSEHGDDGEFGGERHAEFPDETGGEDDVGGFEQGAGDRDEDPGGVDVDAAAVGAGFPGLGEAALEEDDGCGGEVPECGGEGEEVGGSRVGGLFGDAQDEEGDAEHGEAGGLEEAEHADPAEDAAGGGGVGANEVGGVAEAVVRLGEGETGVEDGEGGGDGAVDVVPGEGFVDFEADEESDAPDEEGVDGAGHGRDDDVGGALREAEG